MGVDCRILAVPKHIKNSTVGYSDASPFFDIDYFNELPSAWGGANERGGFCEDVYYCRKNWYLYNFVVDHYGKYLRDLGFDGNGCYMLLTKDIIEEYINKLKWDGPKGFHEETDDVYTLYHTELNRMIRLKAVMEMYEGLLDFYFEGDY